MRHNKRTDDHLPLNVYVLNKIIRKVNGRPASMDRKLRDGDLVSISTSLDLPDLSPPSFAEAASPWTFSTSSSNDGSSSGDSRNRGSSRRSSSPKYGSSEGISLGLVALDDSVNNGSAYTDGDRDRNSSSRSSSRSSSSSSSSSCRCFDAFDPVTSTFASLDETTNANVNTLAFGAATGAAPAPSNTAADAATTSATTSAGTTSGEALPILPDWQLPSFMHAEVLEAWGMQGPLVSTPMDFLTAVSASLK
jgi:hypothetical protein